MGSGKVSRIIPLVYKEVSIVSTTYRLTCLSGLVKNMLKYPY